MRIPWTARRPNQSILKEINHEYSLERLLIKLKSPDEKSQFIGTDLVAGKTIALTIQTFVNKVMSLLFNTLCRFVIAFLSENKCLLIL